jgi:hypothetical protein
VGQAAMAGSGTPRGSVTKSPQARESHPWWAARSVSAVGPKAGSVSPCRSFTLFFFCIFFSLSLFPYSNLNSDLNSNLVPNYPHIIL